MKFFVVVLVAIIGCALAKPGDKYTVKYDNIDLKEILSSDRLTENYVQCLLGKRPCTADGEELKRVLPEALQTDCLKCSPKQKEGAKTVISHLYKRKPDTFKTLQQKFDPQNVYVTKHAEELKAL